MRITALRTGSRGPVLDLRDHRGLVAFLAEGDPLWSEFITVLGDAFDRGGHHRGPGPLVHAPDGPVQVGTAAFEALLQPVLEAHALSREEYAAVWYGAGPVTTWLSAAATLLQGPETTRDAREAAHPPAVAGGAEAPGTKLLAGRLQRLARGAARDVERLSRAREGTKALETRLRELREEVAEAQGEVEVGMMTWARERQDAETRLQLYRDRESELRGRLKAIDEAGGKAVCSSCGRELGDRAGVVRSARGEEWEVVVQDGRWWRRRRDQLENKPDDLKALESRALALGAELDDLSQELERRRVQAAELEAATARRDELAQMEAVPGGKRGRVAADGGGPDETARARVRLQAMARKHVRARIHGKVVALTGGRLVGVFPALFADWAAGGQRGGREFAILGLAARITLVELAVSAGVELGSVVFPAGLDRLNREDLPRMLSELVRLARRIPLLVTEATAHVASSAPECFDLLCRVEAGAGGVRIRHQRSGLGAIWLQGR